MFDRSPARAKRRVGAIVSAGSIAALLTTPSAALGGNELLDGVQKQLDVLKQVTGQPAPRVNDLPKRLGLEPQGQGPSQGQGAPSQPRQGTPGSGGYAPPLHGANPHGQGTVGSVDVNPSDTRPLPPETAGGAAPNQEEIVVGRARGEQGANGAYHGHITIAALFGNEIVGVDTPPGQTRAGPLDAVQTGLLDALCNGSANQICLQVLRADSTTTATGSTNSFAVANAQLGGPTGATAGAAESNGNISQDANCQTATGNSSVVNAGAGGAAVADAATSSSSSTACNNSAPTTQTNGGRVVGLGGAGVPIPAPGCGAGTPDTLTGIPGLLPIICNANDSNGVGEAIGQAFAPYGVREALSVFALDVGGVSLVKATTAGSESRAQAPPAAAAPPPATPPPAKRPPMRRRASTRDKDDSSTGDGGGPGGPGGPSGPSAAGPNAQCSDGIDNDGDGKVDFPDDPECESRDDDSEAAALAMTGTNLLTLLLLGALALGGGLTLRRSAGGIGS